jgi:hypothetical protein
LGDSPSEGSSASSSGSASTAGRLPPQSCGTYSGRGCAPARERVDLRRPSFSKHSTRITNPLYPISALHSVVLLGHVEGQPFRTETTLLPGARTVDWNGQRIRVLVSQYVAYRGGRLEEVALDHYAQADDGSVWYLGEDVLEYREGAAFSTEGTWLAGREGPRAMIMPARPSLGDVYRTENITGVVFEEVSVKSVDETVDGPAGPVDGAMVGSELHLDRTREDKVFAPGYGEFRTAGGGDLEAVALAVPTDALSDTPPAELRFLVTGAGGTLGSVRADDWQAAVATLRRLRVAWRALEHDGPPPMVAARMREALAALTRAVRARRAAPASLAAIDVWQSALDLELRHIPPAEIDAARFELWAQQLLVHAASKDPAGVMSDIATLEWIRDRFTHTLDAAARRDLDARLQALRAAADATCRPLPTTQRAWRGARPPTERSALEPFPAVEGAPNPHYRRRIVRCMVQDPNRVQPARVRELPFGEPRSSRKGGVVAERLLASDLLHRHGCEIGPALLPEVLERLAG